MTQNELQEILTQHKLWLESKGKEGNRADLSGVDLSDFDLSKTNLSKAILSRTNLSIADLSGSDLSFTDLSFANLVSANLSFANLIRSNLSGADLSFSDLSLSNLSNADLSGANLIETDLSKTIGLPKSYISQKHINDLENQLNQTKLELEEKSIEAEEKEKLKEKQNELEKQLENAQKEIDSLQKQLSSNIDKAKESLSKALKNTDEKIKEHTESSKILQKHTKHLIIVTLTLLFIIPVFILNPFNCEWINTIQINIALLTLSLKQWSIVFYTFPIISIIIIITTLLKHNRALLAEIRHFSEMKHQIELYSGLLEASQHTASSFTDPEKAAIYVEETFTLIRNKLLLVEVKQTGKEDKLTSEIDIHNTETLNTIDKITNLVTKIKNL